MADKPIVYEPHPISPERRAELLNAGYRIVDAVYAPTGAQPVKSVAELSVGKGPRGRWYVKRGKEIITGPFDTEAGAEAAKAREV